MSKNMVGADGPQMTSEYGAYALHAGLGRLHALMCTHTPTRPHACTHRLINNAYCFSKATIIRERASMLRYTYISPSCSNTLEASSFENPAFRTTYINFFMTSCSIGYSKLISHSHPTQKHQQQNNQDGKKK